ncbi:hypothetical protein [Stutzerimonas xanthomarina]|uniref:Uncharacterized protein n=2 Tax=Stutzerimonas xanthomarina TaxID=271420 RepID=A0A1M5QXS9_9GAMM|nr:hypothetical protein [Stutzerimonas xanthomarina]MCP9338351.1 hypothetical protein [Stutzerimonas xanthomarina]SEH70573.1 hypothetical protein SAMN05216535_1365 [Stutzerimonas xanthomarina]SHH18363.1 hypothetical protein SAMN02744645_2879 [Stutzerimonas xanthomarina DSM 18231]
MERIDFMLLLIITSFVLMGVGFNFRERGWGIALLGLGIVCVMSTLFYKMQIAFG